MERGGGGSLDGGRGGGGRGFGFGFGRGGGGRRGGRDFYGGRGGHRGGRGAPAPGGRGAPGFRGNGHWRPNSAEGASSSETFHGHQHQYRPHYVNYHHHHYNHHAHHQWGLIKLFRVVKIWDNFRLLCVGDSGTFTLDVRNQANQDQFDTKPTSFYCCKVYKKPGRSKDWTLIEFSKLVTFAGIIPFKMTSESVDESAETSPGKEKRMVLLYRNRNTDGFIDFKFAFKGLLFKHVDELDPALLQSLDRHLRKDKVEKWSDVEIAAFKGEFDESSFFQVFWELEKRKSMLPQGKLTALHEYVCSKVQPFKLSGAENRSWRFFGGDFEQNDDVFTPKLRAMREVYEQLGWELRQQNLFTEVSVVNELYQELYFILEESVHINLSLPSFPHKQIQEVQWVDVLDLQSDRAHYQGIAGDEWTKPLEMLASHVPRTTSTSYIKSPANQQHENTKETTTQEVTQSAEEQQDKTEES